MNSAKSTSKTLIMWFILTGFTSLSYAIEKEVRDVEEKYGDYTALIKSDDPKCQGSLCAHTLTILKNRKKMFELHSNTIGVTYYDSNANFLGNSKPILLINDYSGGAHCCYTYSILDMSNKANLIQKIKTFDSPVDVIEQSNAANKLSFSDTTFNSFANISYAASPQPNIILEFDKKQFVCSAASMKKNFDESELDSIFSNMKSMENEIKLESYFLKNMIELIYTGNAKSAWKLADEFFKSYKFQNMDHKTFNKELLCQLKKSRCINAIKEINKDEITIPTNCSKN